MCVRKVSGCLLVLGLLFCQEAGERHDVGIDGHLAHRGRVCTPVDGSHSAYFEGQRATAHVVRKTLRLARWEKKKKSLYGVVSTEGDPRL